MPYFFVKTMMTNSLVQNGEMVGYFIPVFTGGHNSWKGTQEQLYLTPFSAF